MIRDYIIKEKLGTGSYGVVYKVTKKTDRNIYVLKQISLFGLSNDQINEVENEAKILSQLNSDFVVRYYDSFEEKNFLNIVMEFCNGGDLGGFIEAQKKTGTLLNEEVIWKLFIKTCIGLAYLHKRKILHRDLKALNIFLTKDLEVKIGDLGVAKVLTASNFAKTFIGTPYYLSPEICEERPYNEKSDVWALGCILYELCTFKHPFNANSQGALILKIMKGKYDPVSNLYSNDIKKLVDTMLEKNDKIRPSIFELMKQQSFISKAKSYGLIHCVIRVNPGIETVINSKENPSDDVEKKMKESGHFTLVNLKFKGDNNNGNHNNVFKGSKVAIKKVDRPGSSNKGNMILKGKQIGLSNKINDSNLNGNNNNNNNQPKLESGFGVIQIPQLSKKKYVKITPVKKTDVCPNSSDAFSKEIEINKQIEKFDKCFNKHQQMVKKNNEFIYPMKIENNIDPTPKNNFKYMKKIIIKENNDKDKDKKLIQQINKPDSINENDNNNQKANQIKESVIEFVQELNRKQQQKQFKEETKNDLILHPKQEREKKEKMDKDNNKELTIKTNSEIDTSKDTQKTILPDLQVIPYKYNTKEYINDIDNNNDNFAIISNDNNININDDDFAVIENPNVNLMKDNNNFTSDSEEDVKEKQGIENGTPTQNDNAQCIESITKCKHPMLNDLYSEDENEEETVNLCESVVIKPSPIQSQTKNELLERKKALTSKFNSLKSELNKLIGEEDANMIYQLYKKTETVEDKDDEIFADIQKIITEKYCNKEGEVSDLFIIVD